MVKKLRLYGEMKEHNGKDYYAKEHHAMSELTPKRQRKGHSKWQSEDGYGAARNEMYEIQWFDPCMELGEA